jgi:hypothetical protein
MKDLSECSLNVGEQKLSVKFAQTIELEEELSLEINIPNTQILKNVWVQGVNMYMGKTPVIVESNYVQNESVVHQGKLFLGACSESNMIWQLIVQTKDIRNNTHTYFFNFKTNR